MKKTTAALIAIICFAAVAITATAIALTRAEHTSGSFVSETVDRVDLKFENTEQSFKLSENSGEFLAEIRFTAKKTEPDFYVILNSLNVTGINALRTEIAPAEDSPETGRLNGAVLPAADGKCVEMSWYIRVYFTADDPVVYSPSLTLDFTSGVKESVADRHIYTVPLSFTVN